METLDFLNLKSLKRFAKGTLVVIGFFIVLYCSVAALIIHSGNKLEGNVFYVILVLAGIPLITFLITFILIVLKFFSLIKSYGKMPDESSGNKAENKADNKEIQVLKQKIDDMKEIINTYLEIAKAIRPDSSAEYNEKLKGVLVNRLDRLVNKISEGI